MSRKLRLIILANSIVILMLFASGKSIAFDHFFGSPIRDTSDNFLNAAWILTHEYDPTQRQFAPLTQLDTLSFVQTKVYVNGKQLGTYNIQQQKAILTFKFSKQQIPAFAHYPIAGRYHFRYAFDKLKKRLLLTPLDEQEVEGLVSVEGKTLLFVPAPKL